jgi:hypothetical protein
MALVIPPTQARKIIAYSQNADGTLSPTPLSIAPITTPVVTPNLVAKAWFFIQNADGTLSPTVLS